MKIEVEYSDMKILSIDQELIRKIGVQFVRVVDNNLGKHKPKIVDFDGNVPVYDGIPDAPEEDMIGTGGHYDDDDD